MTNPIAPPKKQQCKVTDLPDGTKYCETHRLTLAQFKDPELVEVGSPTSQKTLWRCEKGGPILDPA